MRIVTIIGARPQFIKAAMISKAIVRNNALNTSHRIEEKILHTGQHYDRNMNEVFIDMLGLQKPDWQLHCGGILSASKMMSEMMNGIESALLEAKPDYVLVYGDTNTTLAGALVASHLNIPLVHIEAGLRSFNKKMPEEINRILTDNIATYLFCPTHTAVQNLVNENIKDGIFFVGDVMYDAALHFGTIAEQNSKILSTLGLSPKKFVLSTVHRAENTNDSERLKPIINALVQIATSECPVILPLHPRTKKYVEEYKLFATIESNKNLRIIEPVDYLDMTMLEKNASTILTDSGGVQKEAYFHRTPCITLREETEWTETVNAGWNRLAGWHTDEIVACMKTPFNPSEITEYGDGHSAEKIINVIMNYEL